MKATWAEPPGKPAGGPAAALGGRPTELLLLLCLAVALGISGCAHRTTRSSIAATAVGSVMRRQVLNAIEAGEGDPVVSRLRRRVAAEADNPEPRVELAAHFGRTGQPELELEHLRLAVERFPGSREAHMGLANAYEEKRMKRDAIKHYQAYLDILPDGPESAVARAAIQRLQ